MENDIESKKHTNKMMVNIKIRRVGPPSDHGSREGEGRM